MNFDWKFYLDMYPDLRKNGIHTEQHAIQHWNTYGKQECRFHCFNWTYYLDIYPDLRQNGVHTEQQAIQHWNTYGKQEDREPDIKIMNSEKIIEDEIDDPIYLFYQFFIHPNEDRYNEIKYCLLKNVQNEFVDKIYLLNERVYSDKELGVSSDKIIQIIIHKRLTYYDAFHFISKNIYGFCCLLNADIYFDSTLCNLKKASKKYIFAQLRFDNDSIKYRNDCQDTWMFHSKYVYILINKECDFPLGMPGCDNRILYIFYKCGFTLINDPYFIKTHHYHSTNIRNYSKKDTIKGHYLHLNPIVLTVL